MGTGYTLMAVIAPLVLAAVIIWAMMRNRTSKASLERTEQATREFYKEEDRIAERDEATRF